ncbi:GbsR/MarR family transcriptional regulator [Aquibacillus koreensis]|uniref:HTH-type transcriptional regulator n=1 Tax=Aquibacillus koreensis TaxID=279446 RepID=A0A9X4AHX7_9BACI|nr:GbsR/MarR family transcriptional regulator [Aquibacillus koreensis]MCT2535556.1 GbsR/MarR family transcriptional regulator [Aquibacillus koreensis]MDC3420159.1 GbsR/MarR family transcriptional regulator [Aquibacillus koreensis]
MPNKERTQEWTDYEEIIEKFVQVIAKNMNLYGITPSVGRLYGALYFSDGPMTLDDMRDALEMSKTSMSTGVRSLSEMKMVEPAYKKGVRKDLYKSEEDWYKSFTSLFGNRWRHHTETNIEEAEEAIQELESIKCDTKDQHLSEQIDRDIERLRYAQNYYRWLMRFIQVVESGEIFKFVPKHDDQK